MLGRVHSWFQKQFQNLIDMRFLMILVFFSTTTAWSQDLETHQWKERVLILKGGSEDYELVENQFNQIRKFEKELLERKLVLYKCVAAKCTYYDFKEKLRFFKIEKPITIFSLELIGLDGGKKFESKTIENAKIIFDLIDSMPMRRSEAKRTKND